tara:strand:+ start:130 stop:438 length:309 start_codon:yes stop_codon:yes gene_type:complete
MIIRKEEQWRGYDTYKRVLATPEEEASCLRRLADAILETLYNEGAMSGKELIKRFYGFDGASRKIIDMILFAHPSIAKIGNTKSRKYYYTEDSKEGLPWLYA